MLTVDLTKPILRKGQLSLRRVPPKLRTELEEHAQLIIDLTESCVGQSYGEWKSTMDNLRGQARDKWRLDGLKKLMLDHCSFDEQGIFDSAKVRKALFLAASEKRVTGFEREALVSQVWQEEFDGKHTLAAFEASLFSDLKDAHLLLEVAPVDALTLVDLWERGQAQAILLRAIRLDVQIEAISPVAMRSLLNFMKFQRLLFEAEPITDGTWLLRIEGPMSMFQSTSKYGLRLAMLLGALEKTGRVALKAEVRWGKDRKECTFQWQSDRDAEDMLLEEREDVLKLLKEFKEPQQGWRAEPATALLLGENGTVVPDLRFIYEPTLASPKEADPKEADSKEANPKEVWLEILGFWNREAVIRRVIWAEKNPQQKVLFAYSEKLRVSEHMLDNNISSAKLMPFKGVLRKSQVLETLTALILKNES